MLIVIFFFFFSSRRRHTRFSRDWSSDVCSSDLLPPAPVPQNLSFAPEALGWFRGTFWPQIGAVAIIIAFGHSLLSMSGFETLAQVYREIAYPKLKNLRYTGNLVCLYAVLSTGFITLFAGMIIPDSARASYVDNLLGGLAMHLAGPAYLRLGF